MNALIAMLGGVRAAIFAGIAALLLIALGVQTWRVHSAQTDVAKLEAAEARWQAAQESNLGTITTLQQRLQQLADERRLEAEKQAEAVKAAQEAADAARKTYERRRRELEKLYANDPNAARWGAAGPPADLLRNLPGADPD